MSTAPEKPSAPESPSKKAAGTFKDSLLLTVRSVVINASKESWEAGIIAILLLTMLSGAGWLFYSNQKIINSNLDVNAATIKQFADDVIILIETNKKELEISKEQLGIMREQKNELHKDLEGLVRAVEDLRRSRLTQPQPQN